MICLCIVKVCRGTYIFKFMWWQLLHYKVWRFPQLKAKSFYKIVGFGNTWHLNSLWYLRNEAYQCVHVRFRCTLQVQVVRFYVFFSVFFFFFTFLITSYNTLHSHSSLLIPSYMVLNFGLNASNFRYWHPSYLYMMKHVIHFLLSANVVLIRGCL